MHLLYSSRSREINDKLAALSLPSRSAHYRSTGPVGDRRRGREELIFPGNLAGRFAYSDQYWRRCRDILVEAGLLAAGPGRQVVLRPTTEGVERKGGAIGHLSLYPEVGGGMP